MRERLLVFLLAFSLLIAYHSRDSSPVEVVEDAVALASEGTAPASATSSTSATASPTGTPTATPTGTPRPTATLLPTSPSPVPVTASPTLTLVPTVTPTSTPAATLAPFLIEQAQPGRTKQPSLADYWEGRADFIVEVEDTGLPMGESDTVVMGNNEFWSYLHASHRSAGTVDQCGNPVAFPGCTVIYRSYDGGHTFQSDNPPVCQFECNQCPCTSAQDHIEQQQYPQTVHDGDGMAIVYEYLGRTMLRRSDDGLNWSGPQRIALSGIWKLWLRGCPAAERIGDHPFVPYDYECLAGGPPGIFLEGDRLYIFMAVGQNPGGMGCYVGNVNAPGADFRRCDNNPLFAGASTYGPIDGTGPDMNPFFDFRTISSAEVQRIGEGDNARYYMLYEGLRGPGPGDAGDTQFGLGLARSLTNRIDGPWEKYSGNPILVDLPGNIGLGHADLVVHEGRTLLYTSLDGVRRSRLALVWK